MDMAMYLCGFLVLVFGTVLGIVSLRGHSYLGLWAGIATLTAGLFGVGFFVHDSWLAQDIAAMKLAKSVAAAKDLIALQIPGFEADFSAGKKPNIVFKLLNAGPNLLQITGVSGGARVRTAGDEDLAADVTRAEKLAAISGPEYPLVSGGESGHSMNPSELTKEAYDSVIAGDKVLLAYAAVRYTDTTTADRISVGYWKFDPDRNAFMSQNAKENKLGDFIPSDEPAVSRQPTLYFSRGLITNFRPEQELDFAMFFENRGGTDAMVHLAGLDFAFIPKKEATDDHIASRLNSIGPQETSGKVGGLANYEVHPARKQVLSKDDIDKVLAGETELYIYGQIHFRDTDGGMYVTSYCGIFDGEAVRRHPIFNLTTGIGAAQLQKQ
jgi:hypothetical protein